MVFVPVVRHEDRPPSPLVQDVANQVADVLRRSATQYPGLTNRDILQALSLAARQARPDWNAARPAAAAAVLGILAASVGAGIVLWRSAGGALSPVVLVAIGAVILAVVSIARRISE